MGVEAKKPTNKNKRDIRQIIMMFSITLAVLSTATYAWFKVSNTPKVLDLALMAGAAGRLQVADDLGNGPGEYGDILDLREATGAEAMAEAILNPVTTKDGIDFYAPLYTGKAVTGVKLLEDNEERRSRYVYEKTFYLKASPNPNMPNSDLIVTAGKLYDIFLIGPAQNNQIRGTYVYQSPDAEGSTVAGDTAANAIRISFETEDGELVIYEPNADVSNQDTNRAEDQVKDEYGNYVTVSQAENGIFINSDNGNNSPVLFTIEEGVDVKVTMRVWIEGTDLDCTNSIALDEISAMFQFMSADVDD